MPGWRLIEISVLAWALAPVAAASVAAAPKASVCLRVIIPSSLAVLMGLAAMTPSLDWGGSNH